MDHTDNLTLEQEFDLKLFSQEVQQLSLEQAKEFLVEQHRLMMLQKTLFQEILKQEMHSKLSSLGA